MPVTIQSEDSAFLIANIIFNHFELNQSCTVYGWENGEPKGMKVVEEITKMDQLVNMAKSKDGRLRRKRYMAPQSIGGYVAQKIWRWKEEMRMGKTVIVIWRIQ